MMPGGEKIVKTTAAHWSKQHVFMCEETEDQTKNLT
jgi:hypothetical protein